MTLSILPIGTFGQFLPSIGGANVANPNAPMVVVTAPPPAVASSESTDAKASMVVVPAPPPAVASNESADAKAPSSGEV
uniref:Uncharacterized protein n=1 Tax=Ditylenchus dipsaci TaxID=166011 RepID=A0A915EFW7_9BILA